MTKQIISTYLLLLSFVVIGCGNKASVQSADTSSTSIVAPAPVPPPPASAPSASATASPAFDVKKVSVHNLPDSVRPYVSQHYPGYTIAAATDDPLCGGAPAIDVAIRAKGKPSYSVIFLPSGSYVQREQDVPLSTAPAPIMTAVKSKYAGFRPGRQIEKLLLADNSIEYSFDLFKQGVQKEVIFSASGEVLCEGSE